MMFSAAHKNIEQEKLMSAYFIFHVRIRDAEKMNAYYDKAGATIEPFHH